MTTLGLIDPCVLLTESHDQARMRRYKHPRYRFEPVPGHSPRASA